MADSKPKKNKHSGPEQEPDVLQYTNYRLFLKDYYLWQKSHSRAFSLRFFAEKAGLSSHAHLKLAMDGKRNVTKGTVTRLIVGLGLQGKKAEYFENLVFFNQASDDQEKQLFYQKLIQSSPISKLAKLEQKQFKIFREWYHCVVREMVTLKDFRSAPEWISRHLEGQISPLEIQESLKILQETDLLTKTANGFRQKDTLLTTDDEVQNLLIKQFHHQMIEMAQNALLNQSPEFRDISSLTFPLRRKDFPALKKHLQLMRKELLNFSAEHGQGDDVVQVNIQLFPLTRE